MSGAQEEVRPPGGTVPSPPAAPDLSQLTSWACQWGVPGLERRIRVSWSHRMTRSLGRCVPSTGVIRLDSRLAGGPPELLEQVLCHEAAHAAAFELHGPGIRAHGPEWKSLMRLAGHPPRASILLAGRLPRRLRRAAPRQRFLHRCPVCGAQRVASYRESRWRCARCLGRGLEGRLVIRRLV